MKHTHRNKSIDVSVIIVNYNVKEYLQQALNSLERSLRSFTFEIIVVDNASDDGSVEMLRQKYRQVILIENNENVGFARANNQAFRYARGKYIFILNPDTLVQEDTVRVLYDFMESHSDAGVAGCKVLNPDGSLQLSCRRSYPTPWVAFTKIIGLSSLFPRSRLFGRYNLTYLNPDETYQVEALSGSCMFVRREVYEKIGGFDETFYMYGEDLDLCYRIQRAGWNVYYVHTTQIVHFKGESTKRSNINELKTFYEAMHIFVKKHYSFAPLLVVFLRFSIAYVAFTARMVSLFKTYGVALLDGALIVVSILIAEYIRKEGIFTFPYGLLVVYTVPPLCTLVTQALLGVYTKHRMSLTHSVLAVVISYTIIAALTAFFKEYAFSRAIILYSGAISLFLLPFWRLVVRLYQGKTSNKALWQRRTLIIGTGKSARELLQRIRKNPAVGYDVIGFINTTHKDIGKKIMDVPILGSVDALYKVASGHAITDVIVAPKTIEYSSILTLLSKNTHKNIVFHIVPTSLEVMVGKANVELIDEVPLVEITYNINKPLKKFTKRLFDILLSTILLVTVYPFFVIFQWKKRTTALWHLPEVFLGNYSFVGRELNSDGSRRESGVYLGKPGLTGIVQLLPNKKLKPEEREQYEIYYARNQSLYFDIEILIKSIMQYLYQRQKRG